MKRRGSKWFVLEITRLFVIVFAFVMISFLTLPHIFEAFAVAPPNIISYQGRVLNASGVPVSSASASMIFELYDSLAGGTCLWSNTSATCATATSRTVTLTDGLFSEDLGDTGDTYAAINDTVFADNAAVYLQITIGGETLTPRKRITAAPYAINSQTLDGLSSADFDFEQIVSNDGDKTLTSSAAFTFAAPTSFTWNDDSSNTLMTLTDSGTTGALNVTGDFTVSGDNIDSAGAPLVFNATAGTAVYVGTGTPDVATSAGALYVTGTFEVDGTTRYDFDSGSILSINKTVTADVSSGAININNTDSAAASTGLRNLIQVNNADDGGATGTPETFIYLNHQDTNESIAAGVFITSSTGGITTGLDVSATNIVNAVDVNSNFILFDEIREAELSTGVLTWEDTSGNDLMTITDSGTTGTLNVTGTLSATDISCTDCLDFTDLADLMNLDAQTTVSVDGSEYFMIQSLLTASDRTNPTLYLYQDNNVTYSNSSSLASFIQADTSSTGDVLNIASYGTGSGIMIDAIGNTASTVPSSASKAGLSIYNSTNTGMGLSMYSNLDGTANAPLAYFYTDNVAFDQDTLTVRTASNNVLGDAIFIDHDGNTGGKALYIDSEATTSTIISVDASAMTTGTALSMTLGTTLTSGKAIDITHQGIITTTQNISNAQLYSIRNLTMNSGADTLTISGPMGYFYSDATITSGTVVDSSNLIDITQAYESSIGNGIQVRTYGQGSGVLVDVRGDSSASIKPSATSEAGIMIAQLGSATNYGMGLGIYTDTGAAASAPLVYLFNDNIAFDQEIMTIENDSTSNAGLRLIQRTVDDQAGTGIGNQAFIIDVYEAANTDEVFIIRSDADGTPDIEFRFENAGQAYADGAFNGGGADYAEYFYTNDVTITDGEVICRDTSNIDAVKRCSAGNDDVVGVISSNPSFVANAGGAEAVNESDPNFVLVGLMGQIETKVTAADGAIAVGDPITASTGTAGVGAKANGPSEIIGFALDPLASGTGTITVLVNSQWYAGNVFSTDGSNVVVNEALVVSSLGTATSGTPGIDSENFTLRGSAWNGVSAQTASMTMFIDVVDSADYKLSIQNGTSEVAFVSNSGDLAIAGRLYPSNEGTLQTDKYIYYEGAGDYMRTNAAGWATGSYDFAEMFPSLQSLVAGEVVVFSNNKESVARSTGVTYDQKIAGIVSTRPGFLAGESNPGDVPIALAGRVPTFVTNENGEIAPGDPLTTSSKPGYAMKATKAGPIVGYAMDSFNGVTGSIIVYVNNSYYDGGAVAQAPAANNSVTNTTAVSSLDVSGNLNMNGNSILSISALRSFTGRWQIEENGNVFTFGRFTHMINSHQGEQVETYATVSRETTIQLSGTADLVNGNAVIDFESIDPKFNDIISTVANYRVFLTPDSPTGPLFAQNRTVNGFSISESGSVSSSKVDWLVIAYHKDFEPVLDPVVTPVSADPIISEPIILDPTLTDPPVIDPIISEPVVTEPVVADPLVIDPAPIELPVTDPVVVDPLLVP